MQDAIMLWVLCGAVAFTLNLMVHRKTKEGVSLLQAFIIDVTFGFASLLVSVVLILREDND